MQQKHWYITLGIIWRICLRTVDYLYVQQSQITIRLKSCEHRLVKVKTNSHFLFTILRLREMPDSYCVLMSITALSAVWAGSAQWVFKALPQWEWTKTKLWITLLNINSLSCRFRKQFSVRFILSPCSHILPFIYCHFKNIDCSCLKKLCNHALHHDV